MSSIRSPKALLLHPLVSADVALFSLVEGALKVLLVQRSNEPDKGRWALPGAVLDPSRDRSLDDVAHRVLRDKLGLASAVPLTQVHALGGPDRDPRGWSISVLFYALLPLDRVPAVVGDTVEAIAWRDAARPGRGLAFDHATQIEEALVRLRDLVESRVLPLHLLPAQFTLTDLQTAVEAILGVPQEKSAFRRRLKDEPALEAIEGAFRGGNQRPAQLYRAAEGFVFEKGRGGR